MLSPLPFASSFVLSVISFILLGLHWSDIKGMFLTLETSLPCGFSYSEEFL